MGVSQLTTTLQTTLSLKTHRIHYTIVEKQGQCCLAGTDRADQSVHVVETMVSYLGSRHGIKKI